MLLSHRFKVCHQPSRLFILQQVCQNSDIWIFSWIKSGFNKFTHTYEIDEHNIFSTYCCKSGISLFCLEDHLKYAYSPFKPFLVLTWPGFQIRRLEGDSQDFFKLMIRYLLKRHLKTSLLTLIKGPVDKTWSNPLFVI